MSEPKRVFMALWHVPGLNLDGDFLLAVKRDAASVEVVMHHAQRLVARKSGERCAKVIGLIEYVPKY